MSAPRLSQWVVVTWILQYLKGASGKEHIEYTSPL